MFILKLKHLSLSSWTVNNIVVLLLFFVPVLSCSHHIMTENNKPSDTALIFCTLKVEFVLISSIQAIFQGLLIYFLLQYVLIFKVKIYINHWLIINRSLFLIPVVVDYCSLFE